MIFWLFVKKILFSEWKKKLNDFFNRQFIYRFKDISNHWLFYSKASEISRRFFIQIFTTLSQQKSPLYRKLFNLKNILLYSFILRLKFTTVGRYTFPPLFTGPLKADVYKSSNMFVYLRILELILNSWNRCHFWT